MTSSQTTPSTPGTWPLLHRFLGIGLVLVAGALVVARLSGVLGESGIDVPIIGYGLAAVSFIMMTTALVAVKPQVPERSPGQSPAQYWSRPEVASRVNLVWFLVEGAGVIASIAYFLTGLAAAAVMMAIAILAFWMVGPNVFVKE
jgi:hypothetical protein